MTNKNNPLEFSEGLSSEKCDFRFTFNNIRYSLSSLDPLENKLTGFSKDGKFGIESSKCDWVISNNYGQGAVYSTGSSLGTEITNRSDNFVGRISSSKCDYSVQAISPRQRVQLASDKCDWGIRSTSDLVSLYANQALNNVNIKTRFDQVRSVINSDKCDFSIAINRGVSNSLRVDSDKCDWKVTLRDKFTLNTVQSLDEGVDISSKIAGGISTGVSSSKCDWRIYANDKLIKYSVLGSPERFSARSQFAGFGSRISSSKCDFSIISLNETGLPVQFKADGIGANIAVSSSKCDWSIRALGGANSLTKRPQFNANLSSSKCDFVLDIEFGIINGTPIRLRAISSSKCDFKLENIKPKLKG